MYQNSRNMNWIKDIFVIQIFYIVILFILFPIYPFSFKKYKSVVMLIYRS